jgi:plasmid maintenance system antidote protein VapI
VVRWWAEPADFHAAPWTPTARAASDHAIAVTGSKHLKWRRPVRADTALLLEALTGWDAQIWLTLQAKWELWHALRARGHRPKVKPLPTALAPAR